MCNLKNVCNAIFKIFEKLSPIVEAVGVIFIPIALYYFTETNQETKELQEKAIRAQTAVQNYLNQLSNILLQGKLESNERLRTITRASTLALLSNPDLQIEPKKQKSIEKDRKGQVISYLSETGLIQLRTSKEGKSDPPIISLNGANLGGANLRGAYLRGAYLREAYMRGAYLPGAYLEGANLGGANLEQANLEGANLERANLQKTNPVVSLSR